MLTLQNHICEGCHSSLVKYPTNESGWCNVCRYIIKPVDWKFVWHNIYGQLKNAPDVVHIYLAIYDDFMEVYYNGKNKKYN